MDYLRWFLKDVLWSLSSVGLGILMLLYLNFLGGPKAAFIEQFALVAMGILASEIILATHRSSAAPKEIEQENQSQNEDHPLPGATGPIEK